MAPLVSALGVVVSLVLPPAAFVLLPGSAARLARASGERPSPAIAFGLAVGVLPLAALLGVLAIPLGGPLVAPVVALVFVSLPALAVVAGRTLGRSRSETSLLAGAVAGVGVLAVHLAFALADGREPGLALSEKLAALAPEMLAVYRKAGWSEASIEVVAEALVASQSVLATHLTGLLLAIAALYGVVLVYPFGRLAGFPLSVRPPAPPAGPESPGPESFSSYRLPIGVTAAFVPAGAIAALASGPLARAGLDVLIGLCVLFFCRGLAIIRALLDRGRFGLLIRVPVYLLALQMPIPLVLALGGLLDEFVDFRSRLGRKGDGADRDEAG